MREELIQIKNVENSSFEEKAEKFVEQLKGARIEEIDLDNIPEVVMEHLENKSKFLTDIRKWEAKNFNKSWVVSHENGEQTFIASQIKESRKLEEEWYFFVRVVGGQIMIYADLINTLECPEEQKEINENKPYIQSLFLGREKDTKSYKMKRVGYGESLVDEMGVFVNSFLNKKMYFDTNLSSDAERFLKRLEEKGKVKSEKESYYRKDIDSGEIIKVGEHDRYVYINK